MEPRKRRRSLTTQTVFTALAFASLAAFLLVGTGILYPRRQEYLAIEAPIMLVLVIATAAFGIAAIITGARVPRDDE
jgi:hypothetical protein